MTFRWGVGPVFIYEWLMTSRRWQMYAGRAAFLLLLLLASVSVWFAQVPDPTHPTIRDLANVGESLFYAIIGTQLCLVLLAAPAATAGSICQDKARGVLTHLFVTDLSNVEIILGKLAARLMAVMGLVLGCLPVLFLATLVGGIDPDALVGAFLVTLGTAVLGSTLALTLSVWGSKTHEVLLANYVIWGVVLLLDPMWDALDRSCGLGFPPPAWLEDANPFYLAFAAYSTPGSKGLADYFLFLGVCLGLSLGLALVAILRVRSVAARQSGRPSQPRRWLPSTWSLAGEKPLFLTPSLDHNPVLWREWHRKRPTFWVRLIWITYALLAALFSGLSILLTVVNARADEMAAFINAFQVSIGLLMLSVTAVTCLAEERVRGSLDLVLTTPLSTRAIVWGKWWGTYRLVPRLTVLPCLVVCAQALHSGKGFAVPVLVLLILAYGAAITSLGLALATWVPQLGRAVAINVTVYLTITAGMLFGLLLLFHGNHQIAEGLATSSPWYGPGLLTYEIGHSHSNHLEFLGWDLFWIAAYSLGAIGFLIATMLTFDRCLGRTVAQAPRLTPDRAFRSAIRSCQAPETSGG